MTRTDVLVIGAGPTGMVAALALARSGVSCVLLERRGEVGRHPKAHELSARSIEILLQLGIAWEDLVREASPHADSTRILFCDTLGAEFGCIDLAGRGGDERYARHVAAPVPYLNLSQVELERVLRAAVRAEPRIDLRLGQSWCAGEEVADRVRSEVQDRASGTRWHAESAFVVCADGAGSPSRKALGIGMVGPEKIRDFVNASFSADLGPVVASRGKLYFILRPACVGGFIAHHIERRWVYNCPVHTPYEAPEDYTPGVMRRRIQAAMGRTDIDIDITSMSHWRMTAQVAARFSQGRFFLCGDAAHRFPPTGGLGMNAGIGDAHNLAWKLAAVLLGRAPIELLDTYEQERRPVIETHCQESHRNADNLLSVLGAFGLSAGSLDALMARLHEGPGELLPQRARDWVLARAHAFGARKLARYHADPAVRARVAAAIAAQRSHFDRIGLDLGVHYAAGAVVPDGVDRPAPADPVSDYLPSTCPGARFPHFWLDAARLRSSHTLVDPARATLLLGAAVDPAAVAPRPGLRVLSLGGLGVPAPRLEAVHRSCGVGRGGALLLRPDGHVAWRQIRWSAPGDAGIDAVLSEACMGPPSTVAAR